jgi:four helix bundle protein
MSYQSFEELLVWQKGRELRKNAFKLVKKFPPEEKYSLSDQLLRSARSVCAQIAEGHGKRTTPDKIKYCIQARGSLSETLNHLTDALDCGYIDDAVLKTFRLQINEVEKLLNGYISYLEKQLP